MQYPNSIARTIRRLAVMPMAHLPPSDPLWQWWNDTAYERMAALKEVNSPTYQPSDIGGIPVYEIVQTIEFIRANTLDQPDMPLHEAAVRLVQSFSVQAVAVERDRIEGLGVSVPAVVEDIPEASSDPIHDPIPEPVLDDGEILAQDAQVLPANLHPH